MTKSFDDDVQDEVDAFLDSGMTLDEWEATRALARLDKKLAAAGEWLTDNGF